MGITLRSTAEADVFIGKKILRVSFSAFDLGLHFPQDCLMLIEEPWLLKDKNGQEIDRYLGLKIRASSDLPVLLDQTLQKADSLDGHLRLTFDQQELKVITPVNSVDSKRLGRPTGFADNVFIPASPVMGGAKTTPVIKAQTLFKDPESLKSLVDQAIVRVSWSLQDIGLYFVGNRMLLVKQPWDLSDHEGHRLKQDLLFRLVGLKLVSYERAAQSWKINFQDGLALMVPQP